MSNPYSQLAAEAYGQSRREWTRVDLLIALYDRAAETLDKVAEAIRAKSDAPRFESHAKAILLMEQIVAGIDPAVASSSADVFRICEFAMNGLDAEDVDSILAAAKAFRTLREGFAAVRDDAIAMERRGEIPPLQVGVETEG